VQFGYEGFARYSFLSLGFWVVMVAGIAFAPVLALLLLGTMWFVAIRYTDGLKD
jgi:hypothetical protein